MKLIVCDVEGTIFKAKYKIDGTDYASTMWQPIALALGDDAIREERETHKKWDNKEYNNYLEWVEATANIHKKYGLEKDTFFRLIESAEYSEGVEEFFNNLDRTKYIPVLISGGFQELIKRAQQELNIKHGFGACEYIWGNDNKIDKWVTQPTDFNDKYTFISLLFRNYNLRDTKDWIFIGDGKNDTDIASRAPISFAINPHVDLASVTTYTIDSFAEIMPIIENDDAPIYISRKRGISNRQALIVGQRSLNLGNDHENPIQSFQAEEEKLKYEFFCKIASQETGTWGEDTLKDVVCTVLNNTKRYLDNDEKIAELNEIINCDCLRTLNFSGYSDINTSYIHFDVGEKTAMKWAMRISSPDIGTKFRQAIVGCRFKIDIAVTLTENLSFGIKVYSQQPKGDFTDLESYRPRLIDDLANKFKFFNGKAIKRVVEKMDYKKVIDYINKNERIFPIILIKEPFINGETLNVDMIARALFTYAHLYLLSSSDFEKVLNMKNIPSMQNKQIDESYATVAIFYPNRSENDPLVQVYYSDEIIQSNDAIDYNYESHSRLVEKRIKAFELNLIDKVICNFKANIETARSNSDITFFEDLRKDELNILLDKAGRMSVENRAELMKSAVSQWELNNKIGFDKIDKHVYNTLKNLNYNSDTYFSKFTGTKQLLTDGELVLSLLKTALTEKNRISNDGIATSVLQPFANAVEVFLRAKILLALPQVSKQTFVSEYHKETFGKLISYIRSQNNDINLLKSSINIDLFCKDLSDFSGERGREMSHSSSIVTIDEANDRKQRMYYLILKIDSGLICN